MGCKLFCKSFRTIFRYHIVPLTIWKQLFLEYWMIRTWSFAHPQNQRAVTRLKNARQLSIRRGKKLGFQLFYRQPLITKFATEVFTNNTTTMVIKLWEFLIFYQILLSPQVKRSLIISNKLVYMSCLTSCQNFMEV